MLASAHENIRSFQNICFLKVLLTGVTGYIAQRLLPVLLDNGHEVVCCVRIKTGLINKYKRDGITVVEADFLDKQSLQAIPDDIDVAYYLIHSMSTSCRRL